MDVSVRIFIINLKRSVDRRRHMEKVMKDIGLPYEFIDAVDGRDLSKEFVEQVHRDSIKFQKYFKKKLTYGEMACAMSHIKVYKKIVEEKIESAIIFEDDIVILETNAFLSFIKQIKEFKLFGLILLGFHNTSTTIETTNFFAKKNSLRLKNRITIAQSNIVIGNPTSFSLGAFAYYIDLFSANKLLSKASPLRMPSDYLTGDAEIYGISLGILNRPIIWVTPESLSKENSTIDKVNESRKVVHLSKLGNWLSLILKRNSKIYKLTRKYYCKIKECVITNLSKYYIKRYKKYDL